MSHPPSSSTPSESNEALWEHHGSILRNPSELFGEPFSTSGLSKKSLEFKATDSFTKLLAKHKITLLVSREYENLLLALNTKKGTLHQTFFHLPHPSGIAVDPTSGTVYVAATRNPNQIVEFQPIQKHIQRKGVTNKSRKGALMPSRSKYFAGAHYFHDLAFIGKALYANAVGKNGIVKIDMNSSSSPTLVWWPKSVDKKGTAETSANYLQLNSIAAGKTLKQSFFSASGERIQKTLPGEHDFPVDGTGVIFSGDTRSVIARGLTRPHSARFYKKNLLVDNSGYGQVGYVRDGKFEPIATLPGWTRGLCVVGDIAFVGVSRVLPRFKHYAPGITPGEDVCGIYALSLTTNEILGSVLFPAGNQIFAIECIPERITDGFIYQELTNTQEERDTFLTYQT